MVISNGVADHPVIFVRGNMITNNQIKEITALRDKSKARKEAGLYIVEGPKMCEEAPKNMVVNTFVTHKCLESNHSWLDGREYELVEERVFEKLSDTKTPQGILSVLKQPQYSLKDMLSQGELYVILEDIQDPGNLGTIIRTAEAAGVAGIIMTKGCVDIFNPKTIRSTMGPIYRVPFVYVEDIAQAINTVKQAGVAVYAAHLKGESYYDDINYGRAAFLIGNEGNGLKEETAALADTYIKIPMEGKVESLNAAVATSILMYEHNRQHRKA